VPLPSAPPQANGAIAGRVEVRQNAQPTARRPNVSDLGMPPHRDTPDRRRSVVYLETAPRGAFEGREGARARMDQRNETFVPHVLAITVGTTVDFPNSDQTYHNVFSLSRTRPFDLGRYASGRSQSVRFDRPGIVRVFCDIHSHMSAFILVFGHRYYSVTDEEARYTIDDVPPGTYTVVVWNELTPQTSKPVTVPADGGAVELNFTLGHEGDRPDGPR
jgi:plastocyanin